MKTCSIDGCERKMFGRGWCQNHYMRWWKRGGDPSVFVLYSFPTQDRSIWKIRFDQKWKQEPDTGCWLWLGDTGKPSSKYAYKYGKFLINGKRTRAHRAAWMIYRGDIAHGLHVLHRCNDAMCVNPDHLYLGTHAENMRDMAVSGRAAQSKFTPDEVRAIRDSPMGCMRLAKKYSVDPSSIKDIRNGKSHKHVT